MEAPIISPNREFQGNRMPTVRKVIAMFFGTKDLRDCGDAICTEWCCGTLERVHLLQKAWVIRPQHHNCAQ